MSLSPAPPDTEAQSADVYVDGSKVARHVLLPGVHTYRACLPPTTRPRERVVELRFARASSPRPSEPSTLAAALHRLEVHATPSFRACDAAP